MELSKKKINHPRMSTEWIIEYLRRRSLTPAEFLLRAESMSQNEMSATFHIQKKDVGLILRELGYDTLAARGNKVGSKNQRAKEAKLVERNALAKSIPDELISHVQKYGLRDAKKVFGTEIVKTLVKSSIDVAVPHASTVRSNILKREVDLKRSQIIERMALARSVVAIADELELNLGHTRSLIYSLNPNYSGSLRSPEQIASTELKIYAAKERISAKQTASIDDLFRSHSKELCESRVLQLLRTERVPTDRVILDTYGEMGAKRGTFQRLYNEVAAIDLEELKPIFTKLIAGWKRCPNFEPSPVLYSMAEYQSIQSSDYLQEFAPLYRSIIFSLDAQRVQKLIDREKISNASELIRGYFPFYHFQSYLEGFVSQSNLIFHERSPEEIIVERFGLDLNLVRDSLTEAVGSVKSLSELYGKYPTVLPYHLHGALSFFSIALPYFSLSEPEVKLKGILDGLGVVYIGHYRKALPSKRELDFYIPEKAIGIEVNPTHTHNSTFGFQKRFEPTPPGYHLGKSKEALGQGIKLIHVYDDDLCRLELLSALLKQQILGYDRVLYGRNVRVIKADAKQAKSVRTFIDENHRQGNVGANVYYQILDLEGVLIGAASFSPAKIHGADWELKRLCFLPGTQVRFGISKIVAKFASDFPDAKRLLSYSNLDYGYSESYEKAGFELLGETGPSLQWVSPTDPLDSYSWSVGTSWGAKSGVIAKALGPRVCSSDEAERLMVEDMPHRTDGLKGYVKLYRAGSKILVRDL